MLWCLMRQDKRKSEWSVGSRSAFLQQVSHGLLQITPFQLQSPLSDVSLETHAYKSQDFLILRASTVIFSARHRARIMRDHPRSTGIRLLYDLPSTRHARRQAVQGGGL